MLKLLSKTVPRKRLNFTLHELTSTTSASFLTNYGKHAAKPSTLADQGRRGLTAEGRMLTRAARVYFLHAAALLAAKREVGSMDDMSRTLASFGGPRRVDVGLLRREFQAKISAANMTRKIDWGAALAEYDRILDSAILQEYASTDEALAAVVTDAKRHKLKAEELVAEEQQKGT